MSKTTELPETRNHGEEISGSPDQGSQVWGQKRKAPCQGHWRKVEAKGRTGRESTEIASSRKQEGSGQGEKRFQFPPRSQWTWSTYPFFLSDKEKQTNHDGISFLGEIKVKEGAVSRRSNTRETASHTNHVSLVSDRSTHASVVEIREAAKARAAETASIRVHLILKPRTRIVASWGALHVNELRPSSQWSLQLPFSLVRLSRWPRQPDGTVSLEVRRPEGAVHPCRAKWTIWPKMITDLTCWSVIFSNSYKTIMPVFWRGFDFSELLWNCNAK